MVSRCVNDNMAKQRGETRTRKVQRGGIEGLAAPQREPAGSQLGEREDGRTAAWGMAFEDHLAVLRDRNSWLSVSSPDCARRMLSRAPDITTHLVWVMAEPT